MKKYEVGEFIHIKPSINELKNHSSRDLPILNLTNQIIDLKVYNKQGFNIYKTFNTFFDGKRRTENINELKAILIDIDYTTKDKEDYLTLRKKCKLLQQKYNIYPYEINDTYKGYHLLFALDESIHYIKNEYYLDLASALVEYFNADVLAKQITGLYKMVGFFDHKDNRNFLIENRYSATQGIKQKYSITIDTLKLLGTIPEEYNYKDVLKDKIYGIKLKWNKVGEINYSKFELEKNEKLEKITQIIEKKTDKQAIYELVENIDANVFIDAINNYQVGHFKDKFIRLQGKKIDDTSGLKLFFNNGKYEIKDFTEKKRFGNRLFLINYVLELNSEKSTIIKKEKLIDYIGFLRNKFGIIFNKSVNSFYINSKILYDYVNHNITIDDNILEGLSKKYNSRNFNIDKDKEKYITAAIYTYMLMDYLRQEEFMNFPTINIPYLRLLELLDMADNHDNRNKLKMILELGSLFLLHFNYINEKGKKIDTYKNIYNIKLKQKTIEYTPIIGSKIIDTNNVSNSLVLLNDKIFYNKGFFGKSNFRFILYTIYAVKKFTHIKLSVNQIKKINGKYKVDNPDKMYIYRKTNEILKYMKKYKLISYYQRNNTTYSIGKIPMKKKNYKNKKSKK